MHLKFIKGLYFDIYYRFLRIIAYILFLFLGLIPKPILSSPRPSSSASAFQQSPHHPSSFSSAANYGLSSTSTTTSKNTTQSTTSPSMPSIGSKATTSTPKSSAEGIKDISSFLLNDIFHVKTLKQSK